MSRGIRMSLFQQPSYQIAVDTVGTVSAAGAPHSATKPGRRARPVRLNGTVNKPNEK
jgi:hypothetical protein